MSAAPHSLRASRRGQRRARYSKPPLAHLQRHAQQLCRPLAGGVPHDLSEQRQAVLGVPPQREPLVRGRDDAEGVVGRHYELVQPAAGRAGQGWSAALP
jgi:hypothetical protein